jgi:endonuclease YncB( thermonuclease family)
MIKRRQAVEGALLLGWAAAFLAGPPPEVASCPRGSLAGVVTHVRDGDTIELGSLAIRLQGLAAPEGDEPGGTEASDAMRALVLGRSLRCELDGDRTHDRCVAVCYLDAEDIAESMVRQGLARDCPRFSGGRYRSAEIRAAAAGATIGKDYVLPVYCRSR